MDPADAGQQVRAALGVVVEPELRRSITTLGFVSSATVDGGRVHVRLRVPPFFQRARYGWLIQSDADAALRSLPWVDAVDVCFEEDQTAAVAQGEPVGEEVRDGVRRVAFLLRQCNLIDELLERGLRPADITGMRIGDLPPAAETAVHLRRRAELGLPVGADAPVVMTVEGAAVLPERLRDHLARVRAITRNAG